MKFVEIYYDTVCTLTGILAAVLKFILDSRCAKLFLLMVALTLVAWLGFHDGEVLGSMIGLSIVPLAGIFVEKGKY